MKEDGSVDELEKEGVELAKQGRFSEARAIFEKVLPARSKPLQRAQVLSNIMLTYDKEGNKDQAITICKKILDTPGLQSTNDGVFLHGQITGRLADLEGRPLSLTTPSVLFGAYFAGAAIGATLGSKLTVQSLNIDGLVTTDLRYGGACLGAVLGFFLFSRFVASIPKLSGIVGIICLIVTANILIEKNTWTGLSILGFLFLLPILAFMVSLNRFKH